ncbi:hypothetical protein CPB84DRAFT_1764646 [Gymnopilus junonius]|uniref:Ubiquitin-like domain-containing protein n=1 Tax=Gymnopilus junonius TaxID=109634 RepID=A0A9P5TSV0_GYMJU|nr:hypothetical protein CPB84DRAFT_1764646 [Gymnopilus junonius]
MNAAETTTQQSAPVTRQAKPPPAGPAPPAPATAPPAPPNHASNVNGHPPPAQNAKGKKRNDVPIDPATMYESLKNRIAALEEEEVLEEEEEKRFAEEAQKSVKGLEDNAIHTKYIELFAELKRLERDHAKEKQKLVKDKDAGALLYVEFHMRYTRMIYFMDNKRLREDGKRLAQSVEEAQEELMRMKNDFAKHVKYREMPDIVVKVVCRYRAELFFKISRKTKLSRLINSWTERMERPAGKDGTMNGSAKSEAATTHYSGTTGLNSGMQFIFTYNGRMLEADQTPEEIGIDEGDEIVAVELMDLTEGGGGSEQWEEHVEPHREKLKKNWTDDPQEAKRTIEEIFDGIVRERLKDVLRQYELRERHFECVIRSKELEVLLSRARAAEQKQLAEGERARTTKVEEENRQLRKDLEDAQNGQTMLIDKLITCCKEIIQKPNAERTQRLFASLREELEKKGPRNAKKQVEGPQVGG